MAIHDILPRGENLKFDDVRDTLNAQGSNVSNSFETMLTNSVINMWSKHKPVQLGGISFCQDFDSGKPFYIADWWRGDDKKCGLDFPVFNSDDVVFNNDSVQRFAQEYAKADYGWSYKRPPLPARIGDFAGYMRHATVPAKSIMPAAGYKPNSAIRMEISGDVPDNTYNLAYKDISNLSGWYLGIAVMYSTYYQGFTTMDYPLSSLGSAGFDLLISAGLRDSGVYRAYPILCYNKSYGSLSKIDTQWVVAHQDPFTFRINTLYGSSISGGMAIYMKAGYAEVIITVKAGNQYSRTKFSRITFSVYKKEGSQSPVWLFGGNFSETPTVEEDKSYTIRKTYTDINYPFSYYRDLIMKGACTMSMSAWAETETVSAESRPSIAAEI